MPVRATTVVDEVSNGFDGHIREQTRKDLAAEGQALPDMPALPVLADGDQLFSVQAKSAVQTSMIIPGTLANTCGQGFERAVLKS